MKDELEVKALEFVARLEVLKKEHSDLVVAHAEDLAMVCVVAPILAEADIETGLVPEHITDKQRKTTLVEATTAAFLLGFEAGQTWKK
jgi:hypothetical protein